MQQEIAEAAAIAQRKFYEEHPDKSQWSSKGVHDYINKAVHKVKTSLLSTLKKQLPIADPKNTDKFLEQVKLHYELPSDPEMGQEKLWSMATSLTHPDQKVKWLERWNKSASLREAVKFPPPGFNDITFLDWLHKATWWSQVLLFYILCYCLTLSFLNIFYVIA